MNPAMGQSPLSIRYKKWLISHKEDLLDRRTLSSKRAPSQPKEEFLLAILCTL
jgi:hypothetical protein